MAMNLTDSERRKVIRSLELKAGDTGEYPTEEEIEAACGRVLASKVAKVGLPSAVDILLWPTYQERMDYVKAHGFKYDDYRDSWVKDLGNGATAAITDSQLRDAPVPIVGPGW